MTDIHELILTKEEREIFDAAQGLTAETAADFLRTICRDSGVDWHLDGTITFKLMKKQVQCLFDIAEHGSGGNWPGLGGDLEDKLIEFTWSVV